MNSYQTLWWEQAKSDYEAFVVLRSQGVPHCHSLHYLQICTEKVAKAYFWRNGKPPATKHDAFVVFLRFLLQTSARHDRIRLATVFGYQRFKNLQDWIRRTLPLAYDIERLAPALAGKNQPNTEYPWPHEEPQNAPVTFSFPTWHELGKPTGRELMRIIHCAVLRFPDFADI